MPLDRQAIEKRDFPIGRRGYDPAAVDAHLARLADEIEALGRQAKRRTDDSLAQSASEQVRAIVEAAEGSAERIERAAEEEAQQLREDAARDAERTRADAVERAQGHVGRVSGATQEMLERVEAMQRELGTLMETLRTGANRVTADLTVLESNMGELYTAAGGERPADEQLSGTSDADPLAPVPVDAADDDLAPAAPADDGTPPAAEPADEDLDGARLIALNMALNGQSREETDRYLAENFDLRGREQLLDEVYRSIETG